MPYLALVLGLLTTILIVTGMERPRSPLRRGVLAGQRRRTGTFRDQARKDTEL